MNLGSFTGISAGVLSIALFSGCVFSEYLSVREARSEYEACVSENGESSPKCRELRERLDREYDDYYETAEEECDHSNSSCRETWTP